MHRIKRIILALPVLVILHIGSVGAQNLDATDALDAFDREEMLNHLEQFRKCTAAGDFDCSSSQLQKAQRYATTAADREMVALGWGQLELAKERALTSDIREKYAAASDRQEQELATMREDSDSASRANIARAEDDIARVDAANAAAQSQSAPITIAHSIQDGMTSALQGAQRLNQIHTQSMRNIEVAQRQKAAQHATDVQREHQRRAQQIAQTREQPRPAPRVATKPVAVIVSAESEPRASVAATAAPATTAAAVSAAAEGKEALAFCWQNKADYWFCDGKIQRLSSGEQELDEPLRLVGCKQPVRITSNGMVTLTNGDETRTGHVYRCGVKLGNGETGKRTWNRDIRQWWSGLQW